MVRLVFRCGRWPHGRYSVLTWRRVCIRSPGVRRCRHIGAAARGVVLEQAETLLDVPQLVVGILRPSVSGSMTSSKQRSMTQVCVAVERIENSQRQW